MVLLGVTSVSANSNLIQYSHELGNVASGGWWSDSALTSVTANGMLAPDGNTVADGLVGTVADSLHYIRSAFIPGVAQNDKLAGTVFAKIGNKNWAVLSIDFRDAGGTALGTGAYYFDISTGTIGSKIEDANVTAHDYKIESAANGFYRIGLVASINDANVNKVYFNAFSAHADNDPDFPGDASTVNTWFWGVDLKKQAYFDDYIPTP